MDRRGLLLARARTRPSLARYLGTNHGLTILRDAGLAETRTQPFRTALEQGSPAVEAVTDDLVDRFALAGTPDDCSSALSRLAEAGLDAPIFYCPPGVELLRQIDLVAEHLVPRWRRLIAARERGDGAEKPTPQSGFGPTTSQR